MPLFQIEARNVPKKIISLEKDVQAQSSSRISLKHSRPKLPTFPTDWLNLHKLPAETPFDAQIAVSHAVVQRRGHANDLAVLLVHGQVATHAAIRTDGVSLGLAAFVPGAGLAHVIFALEHQRAGGANADAVAAIDASRIGQRNVKLRGNVGREAATRHGNGKSILRVYAAGFHALVAENAFGVVADVKIVVDFYRLGDRGAGMRPKRSGCAPYRSI